MSYKRDYGEPIKHDMHIISYKVEKKDGYFFTTMNDKIEIFPVNDCESCSFLSYIGNVLLQISNNTFDGYITGDDDYVIVVENSPWLIKRVYDISEVKDKLPKNILILLRRTQKKYKKANTMKVVSRFTPIIKGLSKGTPVPIIGKKNIGGILDFCRKTRDISYNMEPNYLPYFIAANIPILSLVANNMEFIDVIMKDGSSTFLSAFLYALYLLLGANLYEKSGKITTKSAEKDYIYSCIDIENGDSFAIREMSERLANTLQLFDNGNNEIAHRIGEDLAVLDCYLDKTLLPYKIQLLALEAEYIQYRLTYEKNIYDSRRKNYKNVERDFNERDSIIEKYFSKRLKKIESKIDLTNRTLDSEYCDDSNTVRDFVKQYVKGGKLKEIR